MTHLTSTFYPYPVDFEHYFKTAHLNELLTGQDEVQMKGILQSYPSLIQLNLDHLYLCVGGLPRRIYRNYFFCNASKYMNMFTKIRQQIQETLTRFHCRGELILFNYRDKQIVLLYSPNSHDFQDEQKVAEEFSKLIRIQYTQHLYMDYEPVYPLTVYSGKIELFENIHKTFSRMLKIHELFYFLNRFHTISCDKTLPYSKKISYSDLLLNIDSLRLSMEQKETGSTKQHIDSLFLQLKESLNMQYLDNVLYDLKNLFFHIAQTYNISTEGILQCCEKNQYPTLDHLKLGIAAKADEILLEAKYRKPISPLTQKTVRYIQGHFQQPVTLEQLADMVHVVPNYLSRVFNHDMHQSIPAYLHQLRIQYACKCLRTSSLKIHEIASLSGFESIQHFRRVFKKTVGMTPQQYRQHSSATSDKNE